MNDRNVMLIGASVRAAAFSALRAGLSPGCIDLFADADLRGVASARRCSLSDYPRQLPDLLRKVDPALRDGSGCPDPSRSAGSTLRDAPAAPVIYTGGLENHPGIIERIAAERPIWGNDAAALRKCRDPFYVANLYRDAGIKHPAVARHPTDQRLLRRVDPALRDGSSRPDPSRSAGSTLRKPLAGAGGANITFAKPDEAPASHFYFQQFIPGPAYSAVFCACADRVELLGITEQIVGVEWLHARPFNYCGSVGPVEVSSSCNESLNRIGETLQRGCGLHGLFGVDFILHDGEAWPVEVNPRYTASIEVLEHATGLRAMEWHRLAFDRAPPHPGPLPRSGAEGAKPDRMTTIAGREHERSISLSPASGERAGVRGSSEDRTSGVRGSSRKGTSAIVAKAVLYAPRTFAFPDSVPWSITRDPFAFPEIADVPCAGEVIEAGWPILTLFAHAESIDECRDGLRRRAREIESALFAGAG